MNSCEIEPRTYPCLLITSSETGTIVEGENYYDEMFLFLEKVDDNTGRVKYRRVGLSRIMGPGARTFDTSKNMSLVLV